jgi:hypothetical protein
MQSDKEWCKQAEKKESTARLRFSKIPKHTSIGFYPPPIGTDPPSPANVDDLRPVYHVPTIPSFRNPMLQLCFFEIQKKLLIELPHFLEYTAWQEQGSTRYEIHREPHSR